MSLSVIPVILCCILVGTDLRAQEAGPSSPEKVVSEFCRLDFEGARLKSSADDPIWRLTLDNAELPTEPLVLVASCRPAYVLPNRELVQMVVVYSVLGVVRDRGPHLDYKVDRHEERVTITLIDENGIWKISLKSLKIGPHVGVSAYLDHLGSLIRHREERHLPNDARLVSMLRLRSALTSQEAASPKR